MLLYDDRPGAPTCPSARFPVTSLLLSATNPQVILVNRLKTEATDPKPLLTPDQFINRELSWLEFNQRVLDEALETKNPLLERVKFFSIVSSNLDEFFEVRVAGIKQQMESEVVERSVDGLTATETFRAVNRRVRYSAVARS